MSFPPPTCPVTCKTQIDNKYNEFKTILNACIGDVKKTGSPTTTCTCKQECTSGTVYHRYRVINLVGQGSFYTFVVYHEIYKKYKSLNEESGVLGFPKTDERSTVKSIYGTVGRYNHFEKGTIYWSRYIGTHAIYGVAFNEYEKQNYEHGALGFLISDETPIDNTCSYWDFEGGRIYVRSGNAYTVYRAILSKYLEVKDAQGFGYPRTSTIKATDGSLYNDFECSKIHKCGICRITVKPTYNVQHQDMIF
ncbi:MAG: hypothetical protein FWE73_10965 [Candidatus Bathyarchaeota archaeon]|nr:hypothetical protein [Candidatus Termitimicrobium sp.]